MGGRGRKAREAEGGVPRHRFVELNAVAPRFRLGSFQVNWLGTGFIGPKAWCNYLHCHTHYEICYVFSGRGIFRMQGLDHPVRKGDLMIAKPREEHRILSSREGALGIYFWSYTLSLVAEGSAGVLGGGVREGAGEGRGGGEQRAVDRLLHAFAGSTLCVSPRATGTGRTIELLTEEVTRREPGYRELVYGLCRKLVLDTARAGVGEPLPGEPPEVRGRDPGRSAVEMATLFMRDNFARNLSVRDVAHQVNLSERHFTRLYRKLAGRTPLEMLLQLRMDHAAQLLLDPGLPIKQIAQCSGYPDVRYFTTLFRKRMGLAPAAFRARGGTRHLEREPGKRVAIGARSKGS